MPDNELKIAKKGPNRYPLADRKQCKKTLARLIRDVLNGRIDIDKYRAGVYGICALIQIFKIEAPVDLRVGHLDNGISASDMTPEERQQMAKKIEAELKFMDDEEDTNLRKVNEYITPDREVIGNEIEPETTAEGEAEASSTSLPPAPAVRCGIGAKRLT